MNRNITRKRGGRFAIAIAGTAAAAIALAGCGGAASTGAGESAGAGEIKFTVRLARLPGLPSML